MHLGVWARARRSAISHYELVFPAKPPSSFRDRPAKGPQSLEQDVGFVVIQFCLQRDKAGVLLTMDAG